jgi:putative transposase
VSTAYNKSAMEYKHSKNKVFLMNYHLVWCPKRRKPVLVDTVKERLDQIVREVCKERQVDILAMEIMPDHIHLFLSTNPDMPIQDVIRVIKGRSSNHLRKEFPDLLKLPSLWTHSYFISTAGNVCSETIRRYIEEQSTQ